MLRSLAALLIMTAPASADTADGEALKAMTWDQITEEARGGTVPIGSITGDIDSPLSKTRV